MVENQPVDMVDMVELHDLTLRFYFLENLNPVPKMAGFCPSNNHHF